MANCSEWSQVGSRGRRSRPHPTIHATRTWLRTDARGFSLIELMIALVIGCVGISVAAHVAQMAVRQSGRGAQANQLAASTQIIARQLRTDLEVAGIGSTGAVGVLGADFGPTIVTPGAWNALAVVHGVNNLAGGQSVGGVRVLPGSDAVQVVVPNPRRSARTEAVVERGADAATLRAALDDAAALDGCAVWYVADHSASNGAGRTQLLVPPGGRLAFDARPASSVSCARVSTYWLGDDYALRRADLDPARGSGTLGSGANRIRVPEPDPAQVIAMGVVDLQIAYRTSSALPTVPADADALWAYTERGPSDASRALDVGGAAWFEVRQVRFNIVFRTLRAVDDQPVRELRLASEDRAVTALDAVLPAPARSGAYRFVRLTSSQSLHNQRYFDLAVPSDVAAEPF